jgi:tetratricopeptide (TPR) repeat protein
MALLVMLGLHIKSEYDQRKKEEVLAARRATFNKAQENHRNGQMKEAIDLMNGLGGFFSTEDDLENFKKDLIREAIEKGNSHFENGDYKNSIYYLEILDDFKELPVLSLKEKLSICYTRTGQAQKAINELMELMENGYRNLFIYAQLGKVYLRQQKDTTQALFYYEKARDLTIEYYEAVYGKAYPITINTSGIPVDHYNIYMQLGNIYFDQQRYEDTVQLAEWIKRVWPDQPEAYYLSGRAHGRLQNLAKSCENLVEAVLLGMNIEVPAHCL